MGKETTPFVKWVGGKKQLFEKIKERLPETFNNYYEPFIGGGAILFSLQPTNAHINDINKELINTYQQIKDNTEELITLIHSLDSEECNNVYYKFIREKYNEKIKTNTLDVECAAYFIYLNKHCFNGIYRVNNKGLFNVPKNTKISGSSIRDDNIRNISEYLQTVSISNMDFEEFCKDIKQNDFVYIDSPYISTFDSYTKDNFSLEDHQRLARLFKELDSIGAYLMLSNSNVPMVYELYKDYNIEIVNVSRSINRIGSERRGQEVIIRNYGRNG